MLTDIESVKIGQVDCEAERDLCLAQGIRSYPSIRLYPMGWFNPHGFQ